MAMLISSVDRASLPLSRTRSGKLYHHEQCHDINQNIEDHCNEPSTSYRHNGYSQCSSTNEQSLRFPESPSRLRDAVGPIYGKDLFETLECLGEGFFGQVFKVRSQLDTPGLPRILVMKIAKLTNTGKKNARISAKKAAAKEAEILQKLNHENILVFRGFCVDRDVTHWSLHLLVDFCDSGSLQQLIISTEKEFPLLQRYMVARDIASAMKYVNSKGYMHRDLTSMNILLQSVKNSPYPKAVVADFGLSTEIPKPDDNPQQVGTQNYMSPEMLLEQPYNEKSDVFSFGIILCQMIARIDADHDAGVCRTKDLGICFEEFSKHCPNDTPKTFLQVAAHCCQYKPADRPSFEELYKTLSIIVNNVRKWLRIH